LLHAFFSPRCPLCRLTSLTMSLGPCPLSVLSFCILFWSRNHSVRTYFGCQDLLELGLSPRSSVLAWGPGFSQSLCFFFEDLLWHQNHDFESGRVVGLTLGFFPFETFSMVLCGGELVFGLFPFFCFFSIFCGFSIFFSSPIGQWGACLSYCDATILS